MVYEVRNLVNKIEIAVEEVKEIEAIANAMAKELDVLKKKIAMLKCVLKEEECVRLPK
jgi:hypothetical protein